MPIRALAQSAENRGFCCPFPRFAALGFQVLPHSLAIKAKAGNGLTRYAGR